MENQNKNQNKNCEWRSPNRWDPGSTLLLLPLLPLLRPSQNQRRVCSVLIKSMKILRGFLEMQFPPPPPGRLD